jgi:tetratricopeptide (TPR) repeat protein
MGLCLVGMFGFSVAYRMDHPSLTHTVQRSQHGGGGEETMARIGQLMGKLQENPRDVETLRQLGREFMTVQAWSQAARFWERVVRLEPDDAAAHENLALSYFHQQRFEKAAEQLRLVLDIRPDNLYAHYNLGLLYSNYFSEPDKAKRHLQRVLDSPGAGEQLKSKAREQLRSLKGKE